MQPACSSTLTQTQWTTAHLPTLTTYFVTLTPTRTLDPTTALIISTSTRCAAGSGRCHTEEITSVVTVKPEETRTVTEMRVEGTMMPTLLGVAVTGVVPCSVENANTGDSTETVRGASVLLSSATGSPRISATTSSMANSLSSPSTSGLSFFTSSNTDATSQSTVPSTTISTPPTSATSSDTGPAHLIPGASTPADHMHTHTSSSTNGAIVAGVVLAGLIALSAVFLGGMYLKRRRGRTKKVRDENQDYWERRFRELELEGREEREKGGTGDRAGGAGAVAGGDGGDGGKRSEEAKHLHLSLNLASKALPNRPASRLSAISSFFRRSVPAQTALTEGSDLACRSTYGTASGTGTHYEDRVSRVWRTLTRQFGHRDISIPNAADSDSHHILSPGLATVKGSSGASARFNLPRRQSSLNNGPRNNTPLTYASSPVIKRKYERPGTGYALPIPRVEHTPQPGVLDAGERVLQRPPSSSSSRIEWIRTFYSDADDGGQRYSISPTPRSPLPLLPREFTYQPPKRSEEALPTERGAEPPVSVRPGGLPPPPGPGPGPSRAGSLSRPNRTATPTESSQTKRLTERLSTRPAELENLAKGSFWADCELLEQYARLEAALEAQQSDVPPSTIHYPQPTFKPSSIGRDVRTQGKHNTFTDLDDSKHSDHDAIAIAHPPPPHLTSRFSLDSARTSHSSTLRGTFPPKSDMAEPSPSSPTTSESRY